MNEVGRLAATLSATLVGAVIKKHYGQSGYVGFLAGALTGGAIFQVARMIDNGETPKSKVSVNSDKLFGDLPKMKKIDMDKQGSLDELVDITATMLGKNPAELSEKERADLTEMVKRELGPLAQSPRKRKPKPPPGTDPNQN